MITENLSTLKIHKLSQAQYDRELEAGNIDETALYVTPVSDETSGDAVLYTPQSLTEEQQEIARNNIGAMGTTANNELDMNTFAIYNVDTLMFSSQDDSSPSAYIAREHEDGQPYLRLGENGSDGAIGLNGVRSIDIKDPNGNGVVLETDDTGLYILNHLNSEEPLNLYGVERLHLSGGTIEGVNEINFADDAADARVNNLFSLGFQKDENGNYPLIIGYTNSNKYYLEFDGSAADEPVNLSNIDSIKFNYYSDGEIKNVKTISLIGDGAIENVGSLGLSSVYISSGGLVNEQYGSLLFYDSNHDDKVMLRHIAEPINSDDAATKAYVDIAIGNIESVLDNIIAMQENLIGGESA